MKTKTIAAASLSVLFAATLTTGGVLMIPKTAAAAGEDHLIFSENFDGLDETSFAAKFHDESGMDGNGVELVSGGVKSSGKAMKITDRSIASAEVNFNGAEELTISAWVRTGNSEQRLFSVREGGETWSLKGGSIANSDLSVLVYTNEAGRAVFNHDPNKMGIYTGSNGAVEDYFLITITVERDSVRFYKNDLLVDSYYLSFDDSQKDVANILDGIYAGLGGNELLFGGGSFDDAFLGEYYIDEVRIYDYAVQTYRDLHEIMSAAEGLDAKYAAIVSGAAVEKASSEKQPVLFYDFEEDFSGGTVKNSGTHANGDAQIIGDEFKNENGKLSLNGGAYLFLPENIMPSGTTSFSVSMDITRSTSRNMDAFYYFSKTTYEIAPDEDGSDFDFVDCWFQSSEANMGSVPWLITDYCDGKDNPNWDFTMLEPTDRQFNLTTVYDASGEKPTLYIYIDGHLYSKTNPLNVMSPSDFKYGYIGRGFWDRENFCGLLDNIAIYDYALERDTVLNLANRLTVVVDFPADAADGSDLESRTYPRFASYEEHSYTPDLAALRGLDIDYSSKETQKFSLSQGVDAVVYFRDITPVTESVTYKVSDVRPDTVEVSYSDGTTELLPVEWAKAYEFGGDASYTGTARDKAGRTTNVTLNVTYATDQAALQELIDRAHAVLDFEALYDAETYSAYKASVENALRAAESASGDLLPVIKNLYAAMTAVQEPLRSLDVRIHTATIHYGGNDQERARVSIIASGTDSVLLFNNGKGGEEGEGVTVETFTSSGYASSQTVYLDLEEGDYTVKFVRRTAGNLPSSVITVYLILDGEVIATVADLVSESIGECVCSAENATVADISLLSYYTSADANRYTTDSMAAYNATVEEKNVTSDLGDWIMLTPEEITAMTENAREAYEKLVYTRIVSYTAFPDITCKVGTDVSSLIPSIAQVKYDNNKTASLRITWDKSALDTSKDGTITLRGTVAQYDGSLYEVTVNVVVGSGQAQGGESGKGCGSAIGFAALPCLMVAALAVVIARKKENR